MLIYNLIHSTLSFLMIASWVFFNFIASIAIIMNLKKEKSKALAIVLFFIVPFFAVFYSEGNLTPQGNKWLKNYLIGFLIFACSFIASLSIKPPENPEIERYRKLREARAAAENKTPKVVKVKINFDS